MQLLNAGTEWLSSQYYKLVQHNVTAISSFFLQTNQKSHQKMMTFNFFLFFESRLKLAPNYLFIYFFPKKKIISFFSSKLHRISEKNWVIFSLFELLVPPLIHWMYCAVYDEQPNQTKDQRKKMLVSNNVLIITKQKLDWFQKKLFLVLERFFFLLSLCVPLFRLCGVFVCCYCCLSCGCRRFFFSSLYSFLFLCLCTVNMHICVETEKIYYDVYTRVFMNNTQQKIIHIDTMNGERLTFTLYNIVQQHKHRE